MIDLNACRVALADALRAAELNVSNGDDLVPNGAAIGPFVVSYHTTTDSRISVAGVEVRVMTDRADEASAYGRLDAVMTHLPALLEKAPGPWLAIVVQTARPDSPQQLGEATYASVAFIIELHV